MPSAVKASSNYAQKWTYSNEENYFGSYRAEYDLTDAVTAYAAYGFRHGEERNSLANLTLSNASTGDSTFYRFDNARVDMVNTGEIGLRTKLNTGDISHQFVLAASAFQLNSRNAYIMDFANQYTNNLYMPVQYDQPLATSPAYSGNELSSPKLTTRTRLRSIAIGDNLKAFDDRLNVMFGGRYQTIMQDSYTYNNGVKTAYDESKFTPVLGVSYKLTPEISVYGNYIESLAKGLSNTNNGTTTTLKPFVGKQKEIGTKYENGMFGATISLYDIDKQRAITQNGVFTDDGKYVHRGIELNTYGKVTNAITVLGGATWMQAKQKDTGSALYDDNYEVGVPKFQANLGADWKLPIAADISLNAQLVYTGSTYASLDNKLKVKDWTTLDLGAIYKTLLGQTPTTFNFKINNVFDQNYWASVGLYDNINSTSNTNHGYLVAGLPRTFMLSASFDF